MNDDRLLRDHVVDGALFALLAVPESASTPPRNRLRITNTATVIARGNARLN